VVVQVPSFSQSPLYALSGPEKADGISREGAVGDRRPRDLGSCPLDPSCCPRSLLTEAAPSVSSLFRSKPSFPATQAHSLGPQ
jgi:hypothetical protein